MEENNDESPLVMDGSIRSISFGLADGSEILTYSVNDCPISHPSQLTNPFLGLPLESGRCESCGTAEHGKCEGHFGYIQLPVPVYHPCHLSELKRILSLVCLKCMRMKKGKVKNNRGEEKVSNTACLYCRDLPPISIVEEKKPDGAFCLVLQVSSRTRLRDGFWNFMDKFGYHYDNGSCRSLLPHEVLNILSVVPEETKRRLCVKGYFPQNGFILQFLPVPPNCLYVPEISDGKSIMSSDVSISMLKRVLNRIENIKRSRSGSPNFDSHGAESNELQHLIAQYMHLRGTTKAPHDINKKYAFTTEARESAAKTWLERMKTLFVSKGSGSCSRSVISGDSYIRVNEIGLPSEIAKKITFEERVTEHNRAHLQDIVDKRFCVTYKDGFSTYAIAVGSKGHTDLKVGQVINRRIMDGDIVFINRPPSTDKHSVQAFSVFIHDDHTVKINPLICAPFGADFDGDCIHLFYPQSLAAKAEVQELFSVEKQLLSSHSGSLNLPLVHDALLALKMMWNKVLLEKPVAQQFSMFVSSTLPPPAVFKANNSGPFWTANQLLQGALPGCATCLGERYFISESEILKLDFDRDVLQSTLTEIITSIVTVNGPKEALHFLNEVQPLLMEMLCQDGFSIDLRDFDVPRGVIGKIQSGIQRVSRTLDQLRSTYDELVDLQLDNELKNMKQPIVYFIKSSALGNIIDSKSDSAISKVAQQLGFLGLQLSERGKLYSRTLVDDMFSHYVKKYSTNEVDQPCEAYGLIKSSFFHGLSPYESLVHSISCREVIVRSSRGLSEPGTLFKNLMAILRDVVICYDGTVRNLCSNSIIQYQYEVGFGASTLTDSSAGEPVGVLAATAISNPAYKAVLDSSKSNNSSWELMKEILLCKVNFRNDVIDRRVILYLNECKCGKKFCKENAAFSVQNCLKKVSLKDCTIDFSIEYQKQVTGRDTPEKPSGFVGHIHLDKMRLQMLNQTMDEVLKKCQDAMFRVMKRKGHLSLILRRSLLSVSECCNSQQSDHAMLSQFPCLQFSYSDDSGNSSDESLERALHVMSNTIYPILLETVVKGDPRVHIANIVWVGPDANSWMKNSSRTLMGELALEVIIERDQVRKNGDAWRTVLDACLPVMHLIDTRRSTPYGIQQSQETLGISCAFDQIVQRLSTSIGMVSKGVLKEHLVLVASSMTCSGNVIGFNTGGYKALFRSLKVQVPFTEATLSTPMKCFERAAEKCHTDALASIVSSCSWGKNVAIGTGTRFQILWDQQKVPNEKEVGGDVYDFLELVRTSSEREVGTAYLGVDVDDLEEENENYGDCLSPEPAFGTPAFADGTEGEWKFGNGIGQESDKAGNSSWDVLASTIKSGTKQGWEDGEPCDSEKSRFPASKQGVWSSWDAGKEKQQPIEAAKSKEGDGFPSWENAKVQKNSSFSGNSNTWANWKSNDVDLGRGQCTTSSDTNGWSNIGKPKTKSSDRSPIWNSDGKSNINGNPVFDSNSKSDAWELEGHAGSSWNHMPSKTENDNWNKGKLQDGCGSAKESLAARAAKANDSGSKSVTRDGWGSSAGKSPANPVWDPMLTTKEATPAATSWNDTAFQKKANDSGSKRVARDGWGSSAGKSPANPVWDPIRTTKEATPAATSWNDTSFQKKEKDSGSKSETQDGWGSSARKSPAKPVWDPIRTTKEATRAATSWNDAAFQKKETDSGSRSETRDGWASSARKSPAKPAWDLIQTTKEGSVDRHADSSPSFANSNVWDASCSDKVPANRESNVNTWEQNTPDDKPSQGWRSQGWGSSNATDQRNQNNHSTWSNNRKGGNANRTFPSAGRRPDYYTNEEEKILVEVEPVMQSIRKIMRETSDGGRLSADDQRFIVNDIFKHHPDKDGKVTDQLDYIMVDKHKSFQGTRCFYVVSCDGSSDDFSYIKCMENYLKMNFPEHAESFCRKYFRRGRSERTKDSEREQQQL